MAPLWGSGDASADEPKFAAHHEGMDTSNFTVYGVDETEVGLAATTAYAVSHGGWVGVTTYTDMHGNLRVKSETLVAIGITGLDQSDDAVFPE
jgi:hypothetical protein